MRQHWQSFGVDRSTSDQSHIWWRQYGAKFCHYAPIYENSLRLLLSFEEQGGHSVMVFEVGILRGTGMATWSNLYPKSRIIGLNFDLSNYEALTDRQKNWGLLQTRSPRIMNSTVTRTILNYSIKSRKEIRSTLKKMMPLMTIHLYMPNSRICGRNHLKKSLLVEDNSRVQEEATQRYAGRRDYIG